MIRADLILVTMTYFSRSVQDLSQKVLVCIGGGVEGGCICFLWKHCYILWNDLMKILKKKIRETPTSPRAQFRAKFRPLARLSPKSPPSFTPDWVAGWLLVNSELGQITELSLGQITGLSLGISLDCCWALKLFFKSNQRQSKEQSPEPKSK